MNPRVLQHKFAIRSLLAAGLLAVSCIAVHAQADAPPPPPDGGQPGWGGHRGGNPERQLQMLTRVLSLSSEQQAQVKTILTEQTQKMEELRKSTESSDAPGPSPERRQQMDAIRNDSDTRISALLNDEQKTKFAAWQEQRKSRMERRDGAPPPPPPNE